MQEAQVLSHASPCDSSSVHGVLGKKFAGKVEFNGDFSGGLGDRSREEGEEDEGGGESEGDDDFSFVCLNPDGSLVSADDLFHDGQIRPLFPMFNRDLLFSDATDGDLVANDVLSLQPNIKKVFIEERNALTSLGSQELAAEAAGTYSEWPRKSPETSPELCKKSNSTGFSKLWRLRDLVHHRSNSDGNDAFVFSPSRKSNKEKGEKTYKGLENEVRMGKTWSPTHQKAYAGAGNRGQKEGSKRQTYLPYRQVLTGVGFFTSVNGLSRNVHPF